MLYIMEETVPEQQQLRKFWKLFPKEEQEFISKRRNQKYFEQSILVRVLLFYGLQQEYGIKEFPVMEREEKGKPYLRDYPGIRFNYSHSDAGILVGISNQNIGVDIQARVVYRENVAKSVAHPNELRWLNQVKDPAKGFTELWCLKEAYVKYLGTGIRFSLQELDFSDILCGKKEEKSEKRVVSEEHLSYAVWADEAIPDVIKLNNLNVIF